MKALGLLESGLECLEVDEPTRSTSWRRDYQHRSGRGKSKTEHRGHATPFSGSLLNREQYGGDRT
jgi:hypothetical protein